MSQVLTRVTVNDDLPALIICQINPRDRITRGKVLSRQSISQQRSDQQKENIPGVSKEFGSWKKLILGMPEHLTISQFKIDIPPRNPVAASNGFLSSP
jgi:hypothetical protein